MDAVKTIKVPTELGEYLIEVHMDEDPRNPRGDDNFGTMVCSHRRYNLGDEQVDRLDELLFKLAGIDPDTEEDWTFDKLMDKVKKTHVILPLYIYEHSGITMSTGAFPCRWDSGQVGFIYVTEHDVCVEFNIDDWEKEVPAGDGKMIKAKEYAAELLDDEVETYDDFLTGNVFGYKVFRPGKEDDFDSTWGYAGFDIKKSGLEDTARGAIEHDVDDRMMKKHQQIAQHAKNVKWWIRNKLPFIYRKPLTLNY